MSLFIGSYFLKKINTFELEEKPKFDHEHKYTQTLETNTNTSVLTHHHLLLKEKIDEILENVSHSSDSHPIYSNINLNLTVC